jgi:2,4-dienoyl-CoA reductase-like NADH-dependent reductase (Old Yellow Enzyme family)
VIPDDRLAQPLTLPCGATLQNRIAKAAMTEQMASDDNAPNDGIIRLYERWGGGGAGLLFTGNVMIDRRALEHSRNVVLEDERDAELLRKWTSASTAHGAHIWMQISHPGRQCPKRVSKFPVSSSDIGVKGNGLEAIFAKPRALRSNEIPKVVARFASTAGLAKKFGFTGVQLHAAHGYLISQFLSPLVNQRTDDWGGTPEKRMRFLLETVRATRAEVGGEFPVSVKLNSADFQRGGFSEDDSTSVVQALEAEGVDLLEISGGNYENPAMMGMAESTRKREAYFMDYAQKIRGVAKLPLMLTGGFRSGAAMRSALEEGAIDVVGIARPLALEPDLPKRLLSGETERAAPIEIRIGVRVLDDMMQSFWFNQQMRRIGRGLEPDFSRGIVKTLALGLSEQVIFNPFTSRPRVEY